LTMVLFRTILILVYGHWPFQIHQFVKL